MSRVADNIARLRERIAAAAERSGRDPAGVRLCAVTKTVGLPEIREVVRAGVTILGENRLQVAEPKIRAADDLPPEVSWHFIGHLQRNKARRALELFDEIQSLDGLPLARKLSALCEERGRPLPALIEVNVSGEEAKGGIPAAELADVLPEIRALPGLDVRGLMTMAPYTSDEAIVRGCFAGLRELRDGLGGAASLPELSMGMSGDFELAVEEGATLVRVGTAVFV